MFENQICELSPPFDIGAIGYLDFVQIPFTQFPCDLYVVHLRSPEDYW